MNCRIIIENTAGAPELHTEHGFSLFFTADGLNYLVDTGASGKFIENMQILAQNNRSVPYPGEIDKLILSHAHNDHTGGLSGFLQYNSRAEIILSGHIPGMEFSSARQGRENHRIGPPSLPFTGYPQRFTCIQGSRELSPHVAVIDIYAENNGMHAYPAPCGNRFLYAGEVPDTFNHELAILIRENGAFRIISPCSHHGILNILEACTKYITRRYNGAYTAADLRTYIGGTHLVDYLPAGEADNVTSIARTLRASYPCLKLVSGHCTCAAASGIFARELQNNYRTFFTGCDLSGL